MREAGLFEGRKTAQLGETATESEEEGCGPPCHHWDPWTEGRGWWLRCHRRALGSVEKLKKGLSGAHSLAKPSPPTPHLAQTKP